MPVGDMELANKMSPFVHARKMEADDATPRRIAVEFRREDK